MKIKVNILIFSFVFAILLWIYLSLNFFYTYTIKVPVSVVLRQNQALAEELPKELNITMRGRGWDLLNIAFSKDKVYNLDLSNVRRNTNIITGASIAEKINIPFNVTILKTEPDTLSVNFDNVSERYIKVRPNVILNLKSNYQIIGSPQVMPDSIRVRGSTSVLSKLRFLPTETIVIDDVNSDISRVVAIKDTLSNLLSFEPKRVEVRFNVELAAEKEFTDINIEILNLPSDKEVLLLPPKVSISLRGGVDKLSKLTLADIKATIEYADLERDTLGFIIPKINLPVPADIISVTPQKLEYIIKKRTE